MTHPKHTDDQSPRLASKEEVLRAFGDLDDSAIVQILEAAPFVRDVEEAALWLRGDGDLRAREAMELSDAAIAVVALVSSFKESEPPSASDAALEP